MGHYAGETLFCNPGKDNINRKKLVQFVQRLSFMKLQIEIQLKRFLRFLLKISVVLSLMWQHSCVSFSDTRKRESPYVIFLMF